MDSDIDFDPFISKVIKIGPNLLVIKYFLRTNQENENEM
jgi:hypothetical protein